MQARIGYDFQYSPVSDRDQLYGGRRLAELCLFKLAVYCEEVADLSLSSMVERPTLFLAAKAGKSHESSADFTVAKIRNSAFQVDVTYRGPGNGSRTTVIVGQTSSYDHPLLPRVQGDLMPWVTKFGARDTDEIANFIGDIMEVAGIAIPTNRLNNPENCTEQRARTYAAEAGRIPVALVNGTL